MPLLVSMLDTLRRRGQLVLSIAMRGAVQLSLSFVISAVLYRSLYHVCTACP